MITKEQLIQFTGASGPQVDAQASHALEIAEALINGYCRGRHKNLDGSFRPGIEQVQLTVSSRILANPEQVQVREQVGPYTYFRGEGFSGFTLPELAVLNRYRKRGV